MNTTATTRSISDDDLCATCTRCAYKPGEQSSCAQDFPCTQDADGYVTDCEQFQPNPLTVAPTIRAFHINPFDKTVSEIAMPNDFEGMKRNLLDCHTAERVPLGMGVDAWIDEEGTLVADWSQQGWCRLAGVQVLAGHIVLTGTAHTPDGDEMGDMPAEITLEQVQGLIDFPDYKKVRLPGTSITTFNPDTGEASVEFIGPQWRTYKDH